MLNSTNTFPGVFSNPDTLEPCSSLTLGQGLGLPPAGNWLGLQPPQWPGRQHLTNPAPVLTPAPGPPVPPHV